MMEDQSYSHSEKNRFFEPVPHIAAWLLIVASFVAAVVYVSLRINSNSQEAAQLIGGVASDIGSGEAVAVVEDDESGPAADASEFQDDAPIRKLNQRIIFPFREGEDILP